MDTGRPHPASVQADAASLELAEGRRRLVSRFLEGGPDSRSVATSYADLVDQYFRRRHQESLVGQRLFHSGDRFAFLAVGGYGRRELNLHSDVDMLVLFDHRIPETAKELVTEVFYPLWDLGMELGYGVRSVQDCLQLSRDDFQVMTSMLDARFICGDSPLYLSFLEKLKKKVILKKRAEWARWLEDVQKIRMDTFGDASYLLEPNLKEGIGGLRDYHHILWVARAFLDVLSPRDLEYQGQLSHNEYHELGEHLSFMWMVRDHLHDLAGRRNDRLGFEFQETIADRLGFQDQGNFLAVEQFMGKLHTAMMSLKGLHRSFVSSHAPAFGPRKKAGSPVTLPHNLHVHAGELGIDSATALLADPHLLILIFEEAARLGIPLSMEAKRLVREFLYLVDEDFRRSPDVLQSFTRLVMAPRAYEALDQMFEARLLDALFPDFEKIRDRVQFDAYHIFPVGRHSLETFRYLKSVATEGDILLVDLMADLPDTEPLFLAGLFHDIGKTGKNHEILGAEMVQRLLGQMGYPPSLWKEVAFLVRHHLLLIETATRRDLNEEKMVVHFAREIGDVTRLKMLYLLTWADSRATGPRAWNEWIASLVQELFFKCLHLLEGGELASLDASRRAEATLSEVRRRLKDDPDLDPEPLFGVMSPRYLLACTPAEIARHVSLVRSFQSGDGRRDENAFLLEAREREAEHCVELIFVSMDRPGLFADIAGVLALQHINIFGAQIYTWRDGTALDIFHVTPPADPLDFEARWNRVRKGLQKTFSGEWSLPELLKEKMSSGILCPPHPVLRPLTININNQSSDFFTLIEIAAQDRLGVLYTITRTLFELGLDIRLARIFTQGDQVADVFYVRDIEGQKVEGEARILEVQQTLYQRLGTG